MPKYKYTAYFEKEVLRKRPYLKKDWCIRIIENPIEVSVQSDTRVRFWGRIREFKQSRLQGCNSGRWRYNT